MPNPAKPAAKLMAAPLRIELFSAPRTSTHSAQPGSRKDGAARVVLLRFGRHAPPFTSALGDTIMTRAFLGIFLLVVCGICLAQERIVQCNGQTVIKVDNAIGAQTPFFAVFKIEGDTVTMTEGDRLRFATRYESNAELTRPGRPGYKSDNGNLFFFLDGSSTLSYGNFLG